MHKMGFAPKWTKKIMRCIFTVSYMVNVNGKLEIPCKPTRGLKQVYPINPFLFLICSEGLSTLMKLAVENDILLGVQASKNGPHISHLLFANFFRNNTEE